MDPRSRTIPPGHGQVSTASADGSSSAEALPRDQAAAALEEARAVLIELELNKRIVETKLAEDRRQDPIRQVTGTSSIDGAIESTKELIRLLESAARLEADAERV
jgi:hypothetical protein